MANTALHRDNLVRTAIRLFREKGYAATGLNEILALSGAPKGSLYYYFPGGKEELAAAALNSAGGIVCQTLQALADQFQAPAEFIEAYCALLAEWMQASNFKSGCPITTTVLETVPKSAPITAEGQRAFRAWEALIEKALTSRGCMKEEAQNLARFVIASIEGALIQARVFKSCAPLENVGAQLKALLSEKLGEFETAGEDNS